MFAGYYLGDTISLDLLEGIIGSLPDLQDFDPIMMFFFIVINNVRASFISMVLGVLGGIPPLIIAVINGFFIGHVSYTVALDYGLGVVIAGLLPHGVIEIPSVILSYAAGMGMGYAVINRLRGQGSLKAEFGKAFLLFLTKIIPFLVIAGTIESILISIALGNL
jgi:stage II sporulation protein M